MSGLPKKYARMGFKRGWAAYRSQSRGSTAPKVSIMARRRKSRSRTRVGAPRRALRRSSRRGSFTAGWLPLQPREMLLDFGIGAAVGPLSDFLKPYQQQYLGMFGAYSDEAALAIVGAVAHKFGPSGIFKDAGRELFRVAVISAGQQAGANLLGTQSTSSAGASSSGWV